MSDLTLLTEDQWRNLKVLDEAGRPQRARHTDFARLLGNAGHDYFGDFRIAGFGTYWTKSGERVTTGGSLAKEEYINSCSNGGRPVLPISSSTPPKNEGSFVSTKGDGIYGIKYGYYPQDAAPKEIQKTLEATYKNISPIEGMEYTTDTERRIGDEDRGFMPKHHEVYELDNRRYVRLEVNRNCRLSDGVTYQNGDAVWLEVAPVEWYVDMENGIMFTEKIIFSGVPFNNDKNNRDFDSSIIKAFMDTYLSKELVQSREIGKANEPSQRMPETVTTEPSKRASASENFSQDRDSTLGNLEDLTVEELEEMLDTTEKENARKRETLKQVLIAQIKAEVEEGKAVDAQIKEAKTLKNPNK